MRNLKYHICFFIIDYTSNYDSAVFQHSYMNHELNFEGEIMRYDVIKNKHLIGDYMARQKPINYPDLISKVRKEDKNVTFLDWIRIL